ncbi:TraI domain-containing protein [Raoultella ornithinolytica]|uniref:TraI domain-containing protein n=1 Tax=Raoultella ornithinolytica TaxID=54291 RepID=UPI002FFC9EB2
MLRKLKLGWLGGNHGVQAETEKTKPETMSGGQREEAGFRPVLHATGLLNTPERRKLIRMLRENCPFSEKIIESWWLEPLYMLVVRVQGTPAAWTGSFSHQGGFIDLSLNVAVRAVKLVRGMMLPPGATPEEQAEQSSAWVCAVYWAALFHHLGWLSGVEGATENGRPWYPGLAVPAGAWRIRPAAGKRVSLNSVYMASRLLPESGVLWIQRWPALSEDLFVYLSGAKAESGILNSIISDALAGTGFEKKIEGTETLQPSVIKMDHLQGPGPEHTTPKLSDTGPNLLSSKDNIAHSLETIGTVQDQYDSTEAENAVLVKDRDEITPLLHSAAANTPVELVSAFQNTELSPASTKEAEEDDNCMPLSADELLGVLDQKMAPDISAALSSPVVPAAHDVSRVGEGNNHQNNMQKASQRDMTGGDFLEWLKQSVDDGTLTVNEKDSIMHVLAGFVFLISPDCFYKYINTLPEGNYDKSAIQKGFESLNVHHLRNGKGLYHYHKYDAPDKTGRFTKMSGYMILPGIIFKEGGCPKDSNWLSPRN